ncbi:tautomerase family protein [Synechococcus sp. PROS-9-1]|uniref:tautomerase family protein n=1 Tax=Synechococcus sp. PROS-9-1 TaxID=1968775 RepID=UPI00210793EE|nr:tautomerase family protein [Synechococcus sp. PROS-9-1]
MTEEALDQIQSTIHSCFVKAWGIPNNGGVYIINERPKSRMRISRTMWGINRSEQPPLLLQITSSPRSKALKVELFRVLAEELEKQGVRKEDLFISITPTQPEDWSFGNGVAQLLQEDADSRR